MKYLSKIVTSELAIENDKKRKEEYMSAQIALAFCFILRKSLDIVILRKTHCTSASVVALVLQQTGIDVSLKLFSATVTVCFIRLVRKSDLGTDLEFTGL